MNRLNDFAKALASEQDITELEIALRMAWFIMSQDQARTAPLSSVIATIEQADIRHNINKSRLAARIRKYPNASLKNDEIQIKLPVSEKFATKYAEFLVIRHPEPEDNVLELSSFTGLRAYWIAIARQVNLSYQFGIFDGCAVLARRLIEILIIDLYEAKGLRARIVSGNDYLQLSGLVGVLTSGQDFKLSRNAPKWIAACKELGDNAAHSRTYITKKMDIDEFRASYRRLIAELLALQS